MNPRNFNIDSLDFRNTVGLFSFEMQIDELYSVLNEEGVRFPNETHVFFDEKGFSVEYDENTREIDLFVLRPNADQKLFAKESKIFSLKGTEFKKQANRLFGKERPFIEGSDKIIYLEGDIGVEIDERDNIISVSFGRRDYFQFILDY